MPLAVAASTIIDKLFHSPPPIATCKKKILVIRKKRQGMDTATGSSGPTGPDPIPDTPPGTFESPGTSAEQPPQPLPQKPVEEPCEPAEAPVSPPSELVPATFGEPLPVQPVPPKSMFRGVFKRKA
jgi:hypothetical protein